jgi:hypothetical protein
MFAQRLTVRNRMPIWSRAHEKLHAMTLSQADEPAGFGGSRFARQAGIAIAVAAIQIAGRAFSRR